MLVCPWASMSSAPYARQGSIVTIGPAAQILPPPANYHFPDGQAFVYNAEWHFFTAGTSTVRLEAAGNQHRVSAIADSAGMANRLYGVHDRFEALLIPRRSARSESPSILRKARASAKAK
jgi:uncharacterized protein DUF3108